LRLRLTGRAAGPALIATTGTVGVGLVEAGVGTTQALQASNGTPRAVVLVGTAGLLAAKGESLAIGAAVVVRQIHLLSHAVARGDAYFPPPLPRRVDSDVTLRRALASRAPLADVASPLGITSSRLAARRALAATGCRLENLEVFAAARACAAARVPFAAVLGITNVTGPAAHDQWKANARVAAAAACEVVWDWLVALGLTAPSRR
jgi:adenosylhomocysteine nucleosidase